MARSRPITRARYRAPRPDRQQLAARNESFARARAGRASRHHHGHSHARSLARSRVGDASREVDHATPMRRLRAALAVTAVFLVVEVVGGLARELARAARRRRSHAHRRRRTGLSLFVAWFSRQPASPQKTYGYLRWEVLAAFLNGATLLLISAWIVWEAIAAAARARAAAEWPHARRGHRRTDRQRHRRAHAPLVRRVESQRACGVPARA